MTTSIFSSAPQQLDGQAHGCETVGHYELRDRLGEGGYGEVFEAWDCKLQRRVAVKRIKEAASAGSNSATVREARLAASLRHPAFVKVHTVEEDGLSQMIVMELVLGETVKRQLDNAAVAPSAALDWVIQVAEAMQHAHECGLVHGDLKPSNLMIEPGGQIRILDFGLSLRFDILATSSAPLSQPVGTIMYMAPERFNGTAPSARSDVYALGVILYELVCGMRPHAGLNGLALAAAHLHSDSSTWTYPDSVDAALVALIRAMTARQPHQRLGSMEQVVQRLARVASAAPPGIRIPRWRWKLKPSRLGAWTALAVTVIALGAWRLAPYAGAVMETAAPFSETQHIRDGLEALKSADRRGNLDKANAHFSSVLVNRPSNTAAVAGMALVYALRYGGDGQDDVWMNKAVASAQQALRLDPHLALAHVANGWALDAQGRHEQALQALERAVRIDPGNFFAWYGKVMTLRHAHRYPEALDTLALASARFAQERVFADELGIVYFEQGNYADAEQAFRRSIRLQPDAVTGYTNLNAVLLSQNRAEEALHVLQQGLQVGPSAKLYGNLGTAYFLRGEYVDAVAAFENAVSPTRGAPGDYLNWANLADALLWIPGRQPEARRAYAHAATLLAPRLARSPNDATLASRMGLYAARTGDKATSIRLTAQAIAQAPASAYIRFRAALVYELLGNRQMALAAIVEARRLGFPARMIEAEPDFVALRRDPGYPQN